MTPATEFKLNNFISNQKSTDLTSNPSTLRETLQFRHLISKLWAVTGDAFDVDEEVGVSDDEDAGANDGARQMNVIWVNMYLGDSDAYQSLLSLTGGDDRDWL